MSDETPKAETPKTVTVKALQWHTYNGHAYDVGDTYEIAADLVDSIVVQGKAAPVHPEQATEAHPPSIRRSRADRGE